ncbi:MAG TPA: phosphoribosyltransferase [Acetobacteraceae bacterium]|nr:phosphoribosyltransferase [Acetobacteraceae bacterium]
MTAKGWKGLDTARPPVFIGYDQAERMVLALLDRATAWRPECVAAIMRGGLIPGTMAAAALALELHPLACPRAATPAWLGPAPTCRRVLLVDDCCATGATMRAAAAWLRASGCEVLTLAIAHDPETTSFVPDLSHPITTLFRFPWERGEATPAARAWRADGNPASRHTEAPFHGLDLDGVFLPDIPRADYAADVADALARRHALEPFARWPEFHPDRAVLITGRHEADRDSTAAWLARCGLGSVPLVLRPAAVADDPASVARWKAETATSWGCTHFVESEPEQALRIAAAAPHLIVQWWSAAEARAFVLGAAAG